jgi:hypothetical protein
MPLSWNEIKDRAIHFSKEWENDPLTMPPDLVKAHQELDKAVDLCYRPQPFINETKRIEYLFELYDRYTAGLFAVEKKGKRGKLS